PTGHAIEAGPIAANPQLEDRVQRIQRMTESVARQITLAESIDKLSQSQDRVIAEARTAKAVSRDLAARQRAVAEQIADFEQRRAASFSSTAPTTQPEDSDWRGRAMTALIFARDRMTEMPAQLTAVQEADTARRKSADRAAAARKDIAAASPDRLRAAQRAADGAEQETRDCVEQLEKSLTPLTEEMATDLSDRLEPFVPESSAARDLFGGPLASALSFLHEAAMGDDAQ